MMGRLRDHRPNIPQPQAWATTIFPLLLMLLLLLPLWPPPPLTSVPLPGPSYILQPLSTDDTHHDCPEPVPALSEPPMSPWNLSHFLPSLQPPEKKSGPSVCPRTPQDKMLGTMERSHGP
ncbi:Hypothetical predicted protein [Marmota monax]|uniref:Uncharacterized protein n=1 Tax=Marmota monax TaxID=9995 RepID=A0A5E4B074_MARMO|nr:hypothetical protein GHT09_010939 [Marmota monax]VTJ63123.1 Hypothetical predicted protein [Marmota monax]